MKAPPKSESSNINFRTIFTPKKKGTDLVYKKSPGSPNLSIFSCFLIFLNTNFASDTFFIGGGFQYGFNYAFVGSIFCYIFCTLSYFLLEKTWIYGCTFSYRTIWEFCITKKYLRWVPEISILLNLIYLTIFYIPDCTSLSRMILDFSPNAPRWTYSKYFLTYGITALVCMGSFFIKEVHQFLIISIIGIFSFMISLVIELYLFVRYYFFANENDVIFFSAKPEIIYNISSFKDLFRFLIYMIGITGNTIIIENVLQIIRTPTYNRIKLSYLTSNLFGLLINLFSGVCSALLLMPDSYYSNFFFYFTQTDPEKYSKYSLIYVAEIFLWVKTITTMMIMMWLGARHLIQVFDAQWELSNWKDTRWFPHIYSVLTFVLLNASFVFASEETIAIVEEIGTVGLFVVQFILPAVYYLKINVGKWTLSDIWLYVSFFLLIFGVVGILFSIAAMGMSF